MVWGLLPVLTEKVPNDENPDDGRDIGQEAEDGTVMDPLPVILAERLADRDDHEQAHDIARHGQRNCRGNHDDPAGPALEIHEPENGA